MLALNVPTRGGELLLDFIYNLGPERSTTAVLSAPASGGSGRPRIYAGTITTPQSASRSKSRKRALAQAIRSFSKQERTQCWQSLWSQGVKY